jgi:Domain of unknown function (DUF1707)
VEVLMIREPGDDRAARPAGRGRLRASHADREQAVEVLQDAFVQGRLTKDEFDSRVGRALASRTQGDLSALTADLPAGAPAPRPPRPPVPARTRRPQNTTVKNGARVIAAATVLTGSVWAGALLSGADSQAVGVLVSAFTFLWFGIVILIGSIMLEARLKQRSNKKLPPASGHRGQAPRRALPADPAGPFWPGDHSRRHGAEASRRLLPRPSLIPGAGLNPS